MPLETRIAAISLTPPQDGSLSDDVYRYLIDNFALVRNNLTKHEVRLNLLEQLALLFQVSLQGAMNLTTPEPGADIDGTFQNIDHYTAIVLTEKGVTLDVDTGIFSLDTAGPWLILFRINISFIDLNAGRETFLRVFNITDVDATGASPIFVGRNTAGTSDTPFFPFLLDVTDVDDEYVIQIGGGDTFTVVNWENVILGAFYQGVLGTLAVP